MRGSTISLGIAAAALIAGAAAVEAQCHPTAVVTHAGAAGTTAADAIDGLGATFFDVANPGGVQPAVRITIDFGCTRRFVRLRRRMTRDGFDIAGNRGQHREAIYLSRLGFDSDRVQLSSGASSGWESYAASDGGWEQVPYGWSAWLSKDGAPHETRYVVFDWVDRLDALNEIAVEFEGVPDVDLYADLQGTTAWDEEDNDLVTNHASYTATYGNRGARALNGVRLTITMDHIFRLETGSTCDWETPPPPEWTCGDGEGGRIRCQRSIGRLEPGESRDLWFLACSGEVDGVVDTDLRIEDDGSHGPDAVPEDNRGISVLIAPVCEGGLARHACCAVRGLQCAAYPGTSGCPHTEGPTGGQAAAHGAWGAVRSLGRGLGAAFDAGFASLDYVRLLYRLRDRVLAATPGGRRATRLYEVHSQEIKLLLLANPTLRAQAVTALDAWEDHVRALVDGRGETALVAAPQVAAINTFLATLRPLASLALRAAIDDEAAAIGLTSWADLDIDQALARLDLLSCEPGATALCLGGGRFRVETFWQTPQGRAGTGFAAPLTDDTGTFWFFNPANVEVIVKTVDGCPVNNRKWIFAGGLTNVRVTTVVTDTWSGAVKTYVNPIDTRFQPVQDTSAFASCP